MWGGFIHHDKWRQTSLLMQYNIVMWLLVDLSRKIIQLFSYSILIKDHKDKAFFFGIFFCETFFVIYMQVTWDLKICEKLNKSMIISYLALSFLLRRSQTFSVVISSSYESLQKKKGKNYGWFCIYPIENNIMHIS